MDSAKLINKAKTYLKRIPIDSAHGFAHHKAVARNCMKIVRAEHLNANTQAVIIAAWWHDVESREGATNFVEKEMKLSNLDHQTAKMIISIIRSHTYGKSPKTTEAKVLFDADKMEYFNPQRLKRVLEDAQSGDLPVPALAKYYQTWINRYTAVLDSFHFKYSRRSAERNLVGAKNEIAKIKNFLQLNS